MPPKCQNWALQITGSWGDSGWMGSQRSLIQTLLKPGSAVRLDGVAQDFAQPGLETSEDGDYTTSLGNLLQCLSVLGMKAIFLLSGLNLSFQLLPVVSHPPARNYCEDLSSVLLITSSNPSLLQGEQAPVPQYFPTSLKTRHLHTDGQDLPPATALKQPKYHQD